MSAFYTKYRIEFADVFKTLWKIDIQEYLASQPAITELTATGDPLKIEFNSDSDDWNEPIRPSKAVFNVMATTDFALEDLYSDQDMHFKVLIYFGATLYWQGFIQTGECSEPYNCVPYPVQITAIDGLNYLKSILFASSQTVSSGVETITYYTGRQFESKIILDILGKSQITTFTEYVNLYESTMSSGVGDSPFDQAKIDVDVFKDMYCYDVLAEIFKKYNACIKQVGGVMVITRPAELIGATVYGRVFTAETTKTATSYTPAQNINRVGVASDLKQFPGSNKNIKCAMRRIIIDQDYGYKDSWVKNWQLKSNTIKGSLLAGYTCENWSKTSTHLITPISGSGKDSGTDGVYLSGHNNYPTLTEYIYQSFSTYGITTSNVLNFEFSYLFNNGSGGAQAPTIYVEIKSDNASKYLSEVDEEACVWVDALTRIAITSDSPIGLSNWVTYKRSVEGLPVDGTYTIKIFATDDAMPAVVLGVKNIKIYSTSDSITIKMVPVSRFKWVHWGFEIDLSRKRKTRPVKDYTDREEIVQKKYIVDNAIYGKEINPQYILGDVIDSGIDNVIEQFDGALAVYRTIYSGKVARVDRITKDSVVDESVDITCNGHANTMYNADTKELMVTYFLASNPDFGAVTLKDNHDGSFDITANIAGVDFVGATSISANGTAATITANNAGTPTTRLAPTVNWNTRGGSENKPVLEVIGGETGHQYSRPKQLLQMNISDANITGPTLNIIGNVQDSLNQIDAVNRMFVFNRGELDVKNRIWNSDLMEIII